MDWSPYYPAFIASNENLSACDDRCPTNADALNIRQLVREVEVADIGCGFGGLLVALGPRLPHELLLGKGLEAHQYSFVVLGFALIHSYRFGDPNASHGICTR